MLELAGLYLRRLGSVISSGEGGRQAEAIDVPGHQSGQSSYASRGGWSSVLWAKMGGISIAWSRFEGEERAVFGKRQCDQGQGMYGGSHAKRLRGSSGDEGGLR